MYVCILYNDEVSLLEKAVSIAAPVAAARAEWHGLGRVDSGFGGAEGGGGCCSGAGRAGRALRRLLGSYFTNLQFGPRSTALGPVMMNDADEHHIPTGHGRMVLDGDGEPGEG